MKVAIIGANNFDSLEYHIHDELTNQGHECQIFDFIKILPQKYDFGVSQFSMKYVIWKNQKLVKEVLQFTPDVVIAIYRHLHPLVVKEVKSHKIKIIHINPDALTTFQNQQIFVEPYDAYFTKDPYMVNFMKDKLNLNVFQYNEAFNPRIHKKPEREFSDLEAEIGIDVLCFGNLYPYRVRMLRILKEGGMDIKLFGHKAKYFDPFLNENFQNKGIYGEEKSLILNGAKIVFNNLHYAEVESVNNKFFEITGSGAFQICDYKPILGDLLPINPKKISFQTISEAEKLIKHYLNNPEERWELKKLMHNHFIENYTYKHLIMNIFNKI